MSIQQQQGDEERRRRAEDEAAAYIAARSGYLFCPQHPDRLAVNAHCADTRWCQECIDNRREAAMILRDPYDLHYDTRGETAPDGRNIADTNRQLSKDFAVIESISNRQKRKP